MLTQPAHHATDHLVYVAIKKPQCSLQSGGNITGPTPHSLTSGWNVWFTEEAKHWTHHRLERQGSGSPGTATRCLACQIGGCWSSSNSPQTRRSPQPAGTIGSPPPIQQGWTLGHEGSETHAWSSGRRDRQMRRRVCARRRDTSRQEVAQPLAKALETHGFLREIPPRLYQAACHPCDACLSLIKG